MFKFLNVAMSGVVFSGAFTVLSASALAQLPMQQDTSAMPDPSQLNSASDASGMAGMVNDAMDALGGTDDNRYYDGLNAETMPSVFWTDEQLALIQEIKLGLVQPIDGGAANQGLAATSDIPRDVRLGGIMYKSSSNWIVYINSVKITPNTIPDEIEYLHVMPEYIEIKWYDPMTRSVYPIRLKPNQRFNIDSRQFLPG